MRDNIATVTGNSREPRSVALASTGKFASPGPSRLPFSHYGPVSEVAATQERSAKEIRASGTGWTSWTSRAR